MDISFELNYDNNLWFLSKTNIILAAPHPIAEATLLEEQVIPQPAFVCPYI